MQIKKFSFLKSFSYRFCTGPLKTLNPTKLTGKLTILPTPIGNLQDLSPNIIKALFKADVIGCEDRRVAGKLYTLIKSKNIMEQVVEDFGEVGLSSIIPFQNPENKEKTEQEENYLFYEYANMSEKMRKKFLRKLPKEEQQKFKIDFLKYRALKILQKEDDWMKKEKEDKFDELYGIDSTDLEHIELQIRNTRMKKGRGVLIPLNTYSETRMFNLVKMFLETKNVAIISDAGMPCISDPGWKMVRKIRESLPEVPIEVIGGPSTVSLITLLASMSSKNNSLSGRFEGFAPEIISQMTDRSVEIEAAKKKEFSIHFINSKKLRKKIIEMEKNYGSEQKVLLANELTKLYERKYNGTLAELNNLMSEENNEFEGIGELSYLMYPNQEKILSEKQIQGQEKEEVKNNEEIPEIIEEKPINLGRLSLISIENFIDSIKQAEEEFENGKGKTENPVEDNEAQSVSEEGHNKKKKSSKERIADQASSKDLIDLICTIFGIKSSDARKIVYEKEIKQKNKNLDKKSSFMDPKEAYEAEKLETTEEEAPQGEEKSSARRVGRRTSRRKSENPSAEELEFMKMMSGQGGKFF